MEDYLKAVKSLSEKTRIRILALLHQASEACVTEIVDSLQESQYKVSRHLKVLQDAGMVETRKKGRWIYYQLNENQADFKKTLLKAVQEISSDILKDDLNRLQKRLAKRVNGECASLKSNKYREVTYD